MIGDVAVAFKAERNTIGRPVGVGVPPKNVVNVMYLSVGTQSPAVVNAKVSLLRISRQRHQLRVGSRRVGYDALGNIQVMRDLDDNSESADGG